MEPISIIVSALVMGATAAAQKVGGKAIEDAYEGLKSLIQHRFKRGAAVTALEEDLGSASQRKALEDALAKTGAANDQEALEEALLKARELTLALEKLPRQEFERIGLRVGDLDAVNARFSEIELSGPGTGIDIGRVKLSGDFTVSNIKVRGPT